METWFVEWSEIQQQFHIIKLEEMVKTNMANGFMSKFQIQYFPIGVCSSYEETFDMIDRFKKLRNV